MAQPVKKRLSPKVLTMVSLLMLAVTLLQSSVSHRREEARQVQIAAFEKQNGAFLKKAEREIARMETKAKLTSADWQRIKSIKKNLQEFQVRRTKLR